MEEVPEAPNVKCHKCSYLPPYYLVGAWTNPSEKYDCQNGFIFPNSRGEHPKCLSCHPIKYNGLVDSMYTKHEADVEFGCFTLSSPKDMCPQWEAPSISVMRVLPYQNDLRILNCVQWWGPTRMTKQGSTLPTLALPGNKEWQPSLKAL